MASLKLLKCENNFQWNEFLFSLFFPHLPRHSFLPFFSLYRTQKSLAYGRPIFFSPLCSPNKAELVGCLPVVSSWEKWKSKCLQFMLWLFFFLPFFHFNSKYYIILWRQSKPLRMGKHEKLLFFFSVHNSTTTAAVAVAAMISIENRKFSFIMFDLMILFPKMFAMDDSLPQTLAFTLSALPNLWWLSKHSLPFCLSLSAPKVQWY